MRKKIFIVFLILVLFTLTGCRSSDINNSKLTNRVDYEKIIDNKFSDVEKLDEKVFDTSFNNVEMKLNDLVGDSGNITNVIYDKEKYRGLSFNVKDNKVYATLFELSDGTYKEIDEVEFFDYATLDEYEIIVFFKSINDKPTFFVEKNGSSSILYDVKYHSIMALDVEDKRLVVRPDASLSGSAITLWDEASYVSFVKRRWLRMNGIEKTIFEQNNDAIKIFDIKREHKSSFDIELTHEKNRNIVYGTTTFKNYVKGYTIKVEPKTESKLDKEFTRANLGVYKCSGDFGTIQLELKEFDGEYTYSMALYENGKTYDTEKLNGPWDTTKSKMDLLNEYSVSNGEYKVKNIKYVDDNNIEMEIVLDYLYNESRKDKVIPNGVYKFRKA